MEKLNKKSLRIFALSVFWFHLGWLAMMFIGTIVEIFYPPYAKTQLILAVATAMFQSLGQGWCPLTWLENSIWEKCEPERMYCDPETYKASFIRYCLKKFLHIDAPEGTTTRLLITVLVVTLVQLFSIPWIIPEIIGGIIFIYWFIKSKYWRKIAGNGPLNIIPTYFFVWPMIIISSAITFVVGGFIMLFVARKQIRYRLARIILSDIFEYFSGSNTEVIGEIAEGQHFYFVNHSSYFDAQKAPKSMKKKVGEKWKILSDGKMFYAPPHCLFLWTNGVRVSTKLKQNKNTKMLRSMIKAVQEGYSFYVYHEAERSLGPDDFLLPCKPEMAKMAERKGTPIQLILYFLPKRFQPATWKRAWIVFVPTKIIYGKVIITKGKKVEDIQKEVDEGLQAMLDEQLLLEKQLN